MALEVQSNYRSYLRSELVRRTAANPSYSLRAFSRDLGLSPQILSSVLKGKKNISTEVAAEIAERLGMGSLEASRFLDWVALGQSRSDKVKQIIQFRLSQSDSKDGTLSPRSLDVEMFRVVSDWYHYALLELMRTDDFKNDPAWMSKRLGISTAEVKQALERLATLELTEETRDGGIQPTDQNFSANFGFASAAIKKFTAQLLEKAQTALAEQSIDERNMTTITMAIDPKRLPEAGLMIAQFRRKLCRFLEQGHRSEVYTFLPSLFRISNPIKEHKK
jgi:uncharacterized protein (TIGR02147 family)